MKALVHILYIRITTYVYVCNVKRFVYIYIYILYIYTVISTHTYATVPACDNLWTSQVPMPPLMESSESSMSVYIFHSTPVVCMRPAPPRPMRACLLWNCCRVLTCSKSHLKLHIHIISIHFTSFIFINIHELYNSAVGCPSLRAVLWLVDSPGPFWPSAPAATATPPAPPAPATLDASDAPGIRGECGGRTALQPDTKVETIVLWSNPISYNPMYIYIYIHTYNIHTYKYIYIYVETYFII